MFDQLLIKLFSTKFRKCFKNENLCFRDLLVRFQSLEHIDEDRQVKQSFLLELKMIHSPMVFHRADEKIVHELEQT
jgi:hypothetical protein